MINRGGPTFTSFMSGQYLRIDGSDHGIALYLPLLAQLIHQSDPNVLMKWFFLGVFAVPIALYPVVFWALLDSLILGLVAPLLLLAHFAFAHYADIYWAYALGPATGLPLILLAYRRWGERRMLGVLLAAMAVASFSNSVRTGSGLPVLVSALILLVLVPASWSRRLVLAAVCFAVYLSVSPGLFTVLRAQRDNTLGTAAYRTQTVTPPGTSSGLWHSTYIGLAIAKNNYGITELKDNVPAAYVNSVKPGVPFLSPAYEALLRTRVLHLLSSDPTFVLGAETQKALLTVDDGLQRNWLLLVLLPALLALGRQRRAIRRACLLIAPAPLILFFPPVLTFPYGEQQLGGYEYGFWGGLGLAWLLAILWTARYGLDLVRRRKSRGLPDQRASSRPPGESAGPAPGARRRMRHLRPPAVIAVVSVVALFVLHMTTGGLRQKREYIIYASPTVALDPPKATGPVASWNFLGGLPFEWQPYAGTVVGHQDDSGTRIVTTTPNRGYVAFSPLLTLAPGAYRFTLRARVLHGGMELNLLNTSYTELYWENQTPSGPVDLTLDFIVNRGDHPEIVLNNWTLTHQPSEWLLKSATLVGPPQPPARTRSAMLAAASAKAIGPTPAAQHK